MLNTLRNAWKIPDLRKKMLFTLAMLVIFRLGSYIPIPGIDRVALGQLISQGGIVDFLNMMTGGALQHVAIFAMGITPYINSSIIMQLLTIAIPRLEALAKEGEEGRKKIAQYTRYGTVILALIQGIALSIGFKKYLVSQEFFSIVLVVTTLTAGTAFLMWLGELITDKGIGNGISLLIFTGIVSRIPGGTKNIYDSVSAGNVNVIEVVLFAVFALLIIGAVVLVQEGERKIPVQYAKRMVGRKMYGGQSTHIPLKVNQSGVIPVIFAMSIIEFPKQIAAFFPNSAVNQFFAKWFGQTKIAYMVIYVILIVAFSYFYTAITFNPYEVSNNIKKNGGFIPGIRPGGPTAEYLAKSLARLTLVGGIFLAIVAVIPSFIMRYTSLQIHFGGTSLLILVGVAVETVKQIEAQMVMRNYQGFLK